MMTFSFCNSSMNTEVAPQPQPRSTESWTVRALEVTCDHCRGCSAVSLSGSSQSLASSLFEVGSSSLNWASPFCSVHGISIQVSRIDVAPPEIGFDCVFIPQFWCTLGSICIYIYIYIYICVCVRVFIYMYIYIYKKRERERPKDRDKERQKVCCFWVACQLL